MRNEGIHRLILNVSLFTGMNVKVESDKYVSFTALEEGEWVAFLFRVNRRSLFRFSSFSLVLYSQLITPLASW